MNTSAVFRSRFRRHFWLYVIAAVASLGGLLAGFDMGVISGALLFINDTWNMSDFTKGWVVSSAIVGAVIGAAGNGFLSDIYGRKKVIIATALIFAVGSVICAAAPSIGWLIAGRVILGLAVGMVTSSFRCISPKFRRRKSAACWFRSISWPLPPASYSHTSSTVSLR